MKVKKFKVGDTILCIEDHYLGLIKGGVYEVEEVFNGGSMKVKGNIHVYHSYRFILHNDLYKIY